MQARLGWTSSSERAKRDDPGGHGAWLARNARSFADADDAVRVAAALQLLAKVTADLQGKDDAEAARKAARDAKDAKDAERRVAQQARGTAAAPATGTAPRPKQYFRINVMGPPLGVDETEDSGPTTLSRANKIVRVVWHSLGAGVIRISLQ